MGFKEKADSTHYLGALNRLKDILASQPSGLEEFLP
jgi:hypothetical protein